MASQEQKWAQGGKCSQAQLSVFRWRMQAHRATQGGERMTAPHLCFLLPRSLAVPPQAPAAARDLCPCWPARPHMSQYRQLVQLHGVTATFLLPERSHPAITTAQLHVMVCMQMFALAATNLSPLHVVPSLRR